MGSSKSIATNGVNESDNKLIRIDDNVFFGTNVLHKNQSLIISLKIQRIFLVFVKMSNRLSQIYYKELPLNEYYRTALILFFEQSYQYINEAQLYDEPILIISEDLKSEGSALMIAFIMKKYGLSYAEALAHLTEKGIKKPNDYTKQLKLWFKMRFCINSLEPELRRTLFKIFRYLFEYQILSREFSAQIYSQYKELCDSYFSSLIDIVLDEEWQVSGLCFYHCLQCDKRLFDERVVIKNITQRETHCQNLFTEPINWVIHEKILKYNDLNIAHHSLITGQINCHSCKISIGEYNWRSVYQCNCDLHSGLEHLVFKFNSDSIKTIYF